MSSEAAGVAPLCVCIGEVLWDQLPDGRRLGGAPLNVAAHVAQLGLRGVIVSAVGDDVSGREIMDQIGTMGLGRRGCYGLRLVICTKGSAGSRMLTADRDESRPGYPAPVVDTVGAGDAFTATVITGWFRGMDMAKVQDRANRVAAYVCSQSGAVPRLPLDLVNEFRNAEES